MFATAIFLMVFLGASFKGGGLVTPAAGTPNCPTNGRSILHAVERAIISARGTCQWRRDMEARTLGRHHRGLGQPSFRGVLRLLRSSLKAKCISWSGTFELDVLNHMQDTHYCSAAQMKAVFRLFPVGLRILSHNRRPVVADANLREVTGACDVCPFPPATLRTQVACCWIGYSKYRTIDGTCNNMWDPLAGRSLTPLVRFVEPEYGDGIGQPRVAGVGGEHLPSPRTVSSQLFRSGPAHSMQHTHFLMTFGQFLDHDITKTAITMLAKDNKDCAEPEAVTCGQDGCDTNRDDGNEACFPIPVPEGDETFGSRECLMFVRSQPVPARDCVPGPRQQLNQITHYVDASNIYGSTKAEAEKLRNMSIPEVGLLAVTKYNDLRAFLPQDVESPACDSSIKLFKAGDDRVNENPALTSMHSVWVRVHNHIASYLSEENSHWRGKQVYQETRRIVGAMWQHLVYSEYLPLILGPEAMETFRLNPLQEGFSKDYDPTVTAEIGNGFATAAFRFAHSMIEDVMQLSNPQYTSTKYVNLSSVLECPFEVYDMTHPGGSGVDAIVHGMIDQSASRVDLSFSPEVTEKLFSGSPASFEGTDLVSLNIQRGRDHGIKGYNAWRQWCGLPRATDFIDFRDHMETETIQELENIYNHVDDVDLYAGGLAERSVACGVVGPTFACIIGRQFQRLKIGDRFWYENINGPARFKKDQLAAIRSMTLSKILCHTLDHPISLQKHVLLQADTDFTNQKCKSHGNRLWESLLGGDHNPKVPCEDQRFIDLTPWVTKRSNQRSLNRDRLKYCRFWEKKLKSSRKYPHGYLRDNY